MIELTNEEKICAFNKIAAAYYDKNFGSMSKSDLEVLMFSEYIEHHLNKQLDFSDYALSKELGISQNRVRSLKEKKELKYPHRGFNWKQGLSEALKTAKYDKSSHTVKMIISDVNVQIEFRNYIEKQGWYDEYSINKKMSVVPISGFIDLFGDDIEYNDESIKRIKIICKENPDSKGNELKNLITDFSKESLKSFLMNGTAESIIAVLTAIPFGSFAKPVIDALIKIIGG